MNDSPIDIVDIKLGSRSYPILIGQGEALWEQAQQYFPKGSSAVIVSNTKVAPLYALALEKRLQPHYNKVQTITLPDGEQYKNWETLQLIFTDLLEQGADRKTVIYALGGGVIGDMAGFAAACYMRGVDFVQVPTTLLAQVDSSVGGKTGINHSLGKNMIGAFYQPRLVVCDIATLETLEFAQLSSGLAEVIKYGPIYDMDFFAWLQKNMSALLALDDSALRFAIRRSCEIKAAVVNTDEKESGLREILNFGHTFGHAIEAGMGYGKWLHGQGVAVGMVLATQLSERLGYLADSSFLPSLIDLLQQANLPITAPCLRQSDNPQRYIELMRVDKKTQAGQLRFVLLNPPGKATTYAVDDDIVLQLLRTVLE